MTVSINGSGGVITDEQIQGWICDAIFNEALYFTQPFQHAQLANFFPAEIYQLLLDNWPEDGWHELVHPDQLKPDGTYRRRQMRVADAFPQLGRVLEDPSLVRAWFSTFGMEQPAECYPQALLLDDEEGYWIRPHPDTANKQITVQIYVAEDKEAPHMGTWLGDKFCPYFPNTGFAFPVSGGTIHEVKPDVCDRRRRSIQILHYTSPDPNIRYA